MGWILWTVCLLVLWIIVEYVINRMFHRDELEEDKDDSCPYE